MIDPKNLWVGDNIKSIVTGRIGTFEGIHSSGKIRLKSQGKLYLVSAKNAETYEIKEEHYIDLNLDEPTVLSKYKAFSDLLDLHIEKLNPSLVNALPERIVDFQIKALESYINEVKSRKVHEVTIVHGKGKGVLKSIVESFLNSDQDVFSVNSINSDGAVKVFLAY